MRNFAMRSLLITLVSIAAVLAAHGQVPAPHTLSDADTLLRVDGAGTAQGFTLAGLKKLPHLKIAVVDRDGTTTYEGVTVEDLLRIVDAPVGEKLRGREVAAHAVRITGGDGYSAYFMLPEIDSSFTDQKIIVAYSRDGRSIEGRDGPLEIVVPREKRHARWVRGAAAIELVELPRK